MTSPANDPLLQPLKVGHVTLKNRIMSTSHACGLDKDGYPQEAYQAYHEEKAKGGLALTMFGGSSNVAPDSPNTFRQLHLGNDGCIPHLQKFAERIHAHGCALMCQITHLGRRGDPYGDHWLEMIGPSPVRETRHRAIPREMDEHDIARVIKAFGDTAARCKEGGLDGIETLFGGHLVGQFLSPVTNKRTDKYGGSLENRARFALEVYREIRKRTGDKFLVGMRYIVDEGISDGLTFDDAVSVAKMFEDEGLVDFFNAIYGRMDTYYALAMHNMPGMASPIAPWLEKAGAFKREMSRPVFHAARIADLATARHAIRDGLIDMAAMTRAHIADPHIVAKLMRGEEDRIRPCVGATHCMGAHRPTCLHNAATGRELSGGHDVGKAAERRKIVVVGAGPAGLEAARVSAERGHQVTVLEAAPQAGGQLLLANHASWRKDITGLIDWRVGELEALGVEVRYNTFAEPEDVSALSPDVVIIATGGVPNPGWFEGADLASSAWDVIGGEAAQGQDVLVYDGTGRHSAMTAAEKLARDGHNVTFVTVDETVAEEQGYAERVGWKREMYKLGFDVLRDRELVGLEKHGNRLKAILRNEFTGDTQEHTVDQVVTDFGTLAVDEVYQQLRAGSANDGVKDIDCLITGKPQPVRAGNGSYELYRIGDASASRNVAAAVYDALRLCRTL
jgi:2,4-dienoyl-CoA reductase-like NADH-dependent reductase (Old Yellow Enzyme family)/thioredoxin reductase